MEQNYPFFVINKKRKFDKIPYAEIIYLEGKINYTLVHLKSGKTKLSARTLKFHIEHSLNDSFWRIHRSFCVNSKYIEQYDEELNQGFLLLKSGAKLAVSRRMKHVLFES